MFDLAEVLLLTLCLCLLREIRYMSKIPLLPCNQEKAKSACSQKIHSVLCRERGQQSINGTVSAHLLTASMTPFLSDLVSLGVAPWRWSVIFDCKSGDILTSLSVLAGRPKFDGAKRRFLNWWSTFSFSCSHRKGKCWNRFNGAPKSINAPGVANMISRHARLKTTI